MTTILILGGYGYTGRCLARHLLQQSGAALVLAGRHLDKAEELAAHLNREFSARRVSARCVDAASYQSLIDGLSGIDLLLVASNTTQQAANVIQAALEMGVDYLDVQLNGRKLALLQSRAAEIEKAGRCFITEAGFHPGLPAALVRYASSCYDRLDEVTTACFLNMGHDMPYTQAVDELMEMFLDYQAQVYKAGKWTKPSQFVMRAIDFGSTSSGAAIGKRLCSSMFFEELRDLPEMIPSLQSVGFYIAGTHWFNDWVITPVVMAGLKIAPRRGIRPMGRLMWWGMQNFHHPPYVVLLKFEAMGEKDGKSMLLEGSVSHPDGYELTAIPVVACLLQVLDGGAARKPGLWMMGHLIDPQRLFEDMQRMGVSVEVRMQEARPAA